MIIISNKGSAGQTMAEVTQGQPQLFSGHSSCKARTHVSTPTDLSGIKSALTASNLEQLALFYFTYHECGACASVAKLGQTGRTSTT